MDARAALQDTTKQAFMRGVCALNIEAMSLMGNQFLPVDAAAPPTPPPAVPPSRDVAPPSPADAVPVPRTTNPPRPNTSGSGLASEQTALAFTPSQDPRVRVTRRASTLGHL